MLYSLIPRGSDRATGAAAEGAPLRRWIYR